MMILKNKNISWLAALAGVAGICLVCSCNRNGTSPDYQEEEPQAAIRIGALGKSPMGEFVVQDVETRAMEDFPLVNDQNDFELYKDPIALFGYYVPSIENGVHSAGVEHSDKCGYIGNTRDEILENAANHSGIAQQAANVLRESVNGVDPDPNMNYRTFMRNAEYTWSDKVDAYVSYDVAAFWRPNAYHYFICYAPPIQDFEDDGDDFYVTLKTEERGVEGAPDFNFVYGRKVLEYNASSRFDPHHRRQHPGAGQLSNGIDIYVTPQLAQLRLTLRCSEELKGAIVMYGFRVETYKTAKFNLNACTWSFDDNNNGDGTFKTETIVRFYDNELLVPTRSEHSTMYGTDSQGNKFDNLPRYTVSLFPNLETATTPIDDETVRVVKKLEVCLNNHWYDVTGIAEMWDRDGNGAENTGSNAVPLIAGTTTMGVIDVDRANPDDWNKLVITFSNWRVEKDHSYEGVFE